MQGFIVELQEYFIQVANTLGILSEIVDFLIKYKSLFLTQILTKSKYIIALRETEKSPETFLSLTPHSDTYKRKRLSKIS